MMIRISILLFLLCLQSCGLFSPAEQTVSEESAEPDFSVPFPVKDPPKFSAKLVITSFEPNERKRVYVVAKDGIQRFETFGAGTDTEFSILTNQKGETYKLDPRSKTYKLLPVGSAAPSDDSLSKALTSRWLNRKRRARFNDFGIENGLKKYLVTVDESKNTEVFIFIDEKLQYPVRQEIYSVEGNPKKLVVKMELIEISTSPDPSMFKLPQGFTEESPAK